jgi:hypothetical protein
MDVDLPVGSLAVPVAGLCGFRRHGQVRVVDRRLHIGLVLAPVMQATCDYIIRTGSGWLNSHRVGALCLSYN